MKKLILTVLSSTLLSYSLFSQEKTEVQKRTCSAVELWDRAVAKDPSLNARMKQIEAHTHERVLAKQLQEKQTGAKIVNGIYRIPVVVHVLYTNSSNNISKEQVQSQIDVLNRDYRRLNPDRNNKWKQAADAKIEFYLAKVDPNGNSTSGITRKHVSKSSWYIGHSMKSSSNGGVSPWNTNEYLNIWIVDRITNGQGGSILGFAQFPWDSRKSTDGVVICDEYFGTVGTARAPFDGGRTSTHEVGHYLGLRHIWGDGGCNVDDQVNDTPLSDAANYGCKSNHRSCGSLDMVQNYMDYSDDGCMNLFTKGQVQRMHSFLEQGGARRALALSDKTGNGGGDGSACNATTPTNIKVVKVTTQKAKLAWSDVEKAGFEVRFKEERATSWRKGSVNEPTVEVTGLKPSTKYVFQVRSICGNGKRSSYSEAKYFSTPTAGGGSEEYCTSSSRSSADEYIQRVQIGSIDNKSGSRPYSDFTSVSTKLKASNTITIVPKWTDGSSYKEGYAVFIDYNQDGDFEDQGETVWSQRPTKQAKVTGTFKLPSFAKKGKTRMRVSLKYKAMPANGCEVFKYGEVEDYTVVIGGTSSNDKEPPTKPTNLVASNVGSNSVALTWNPSKDNLGVAGYKVFVQNSVAKTVQSNEALVSGLRPSTKYTFYVQAFDDAGNLSSASESIKVTTASGSAGSDYCKIKAGNYSYNWIDYVAIGGMENKSSNKKGGYSDFTDKTGVMVKGQPINLSLSSGFYSNRFSVYWRVWIDFNQDGQFSSSEKIVSGASSKSNVMKVRIKAPENAKTGTTRMRVVARYGSRPSPCGGFGYGEAEDYSINIKENSYNYDSSSQRLLSREDSDTNLTIYPNPALDIINVVLDTATTTKSISYTIVNTIGSMVKTGKLLDDSIDISDLSPGIYILEVNDGYKTLKSRLIKK